MALIPFGPLSFDLPVYDNPGTTYLLNLVPRTRRSYGPWPEMVQQSSNALDARAQGLVSGIDYSGGSYVFAGDVGKLYRYTGNSFSDVSKLGGYTSSAGYTDVVSRAWRFQTFNDVMIATNFADPPQKFDMGSDSAFDDMAKNTAPRARYSAVVQNHLVLANTDDQFDGHIGLRLWFSPVGNPLDDDWGNTNKQSDFRTLPTGKEITGIVGGEFGIIFCRRSIYRMTYAGPPVIYQIDEINPQHGCTIPGSIAYNENRIFYYAEDGFQTMVNGGPNVPIGQDKVDNFFTSNVDTSNIERCHATIDEKRKLYLISFPSSSFTRSSVGTPNITLAYNYELNEWGLIVQETDLIDNVESPALTVEDLGAIYTYTDNVPGLTDDPAWQGGDPFLAAFKPNRHLHTFGGANKEFTIDTPEKNFIEGRRSIFNSARPVTNCDCPELAVGVRNAQSNENPTFTASRAPNSRSNLCTFKAGAKGLYHRVRMTAPDGWTGDEVVGIDGIEVTDGGQP